MNRFKSLTKKEVLKYFDGVNFKTEPAHHQLVSMLFALVNGPRVIIANDMGTGKSKVALDLLNLTESKRTLILCPNSMLNDDGWGREIKKHTDKSYVILKGTEAERKKYINEDADIFLINYEGLMWTFGHFVATAKCTNKKCDFLTIFLDKEDEFFIKSCPRCLCSFDKNTYKKTHIIDELFIKNAEIEHFIVDEVHHLAYANSLQTQIAKSISASSKYVTFLSGTIISSSILNLWSEFFVLDNGMTLGPNFYAFRNIYFDSIEKQFYDRKRKARRIYKEWKIKDGSVDSILKRIDKKVIRYELEECFDLPDETEEIRSVDMSIEQFRILETIQNNLQIQIQKKLITKQDILNKTGKMFQILSGFFIDKEETVRLKDNPKLDELEKCLWEMDTKCILYHWFVEEGKIIEDFCRKKQIEFCSIRGEIKDKGAQLKKFREDKNIKLLICNIRSGGESLNLQFVHVELFFSIGYLNSEKLRQVKRRIKRKGQKNKCLYIYFVVKNTVEEAALKSLQKGKELSDTIYTYISNKMGLMK